MAINADLPTENLDPLFSVAIGIVTPVELEIARIDLKQMKSKDCCQNTKENH